MAFKMKWSTFLAPAYAILEGLFVGSISAMYDYMYPGLPLQAVALTLLVTLIMFLIYRYRIIKVTQKLRTVVVVATAAIAVFYLVQWLTFHFLVLRWPILLLIHLPPSVLVFPSWFQVLLLSTCY